MINPSSANADLNARKGILAWMTILPALFPLVALLTYDWRAIPALNMPPTQSTNWIGALGDFFAYYGYATFGLAIWVVPLLCVFAAIGFIRGSRILDAACGLLHFSFLPPASCRSSAHTPA